MNDTTTQLIELVAANYPMDKAKITNLKCGDKEASIARYMVYKLMQVAGYTTSEIAEAFGGKAENVTKALKRFKEWKRIYPLMKIKYETIEHKYNDHQTYSRTSTETA